MKREQQPLTAEEQSMMEQYYKWQELTFKERKRRLKQMQAEDALRGAESTADGLQPDSQ